MDDEGVTDVLLNGYRDVWFEREGTIRRAPLRWDGDELDAFVERLLFQADVRADMAQPIVSGRLVDGSRVHVVLPPVSPTGPLVAIRRFPRRRLTMADLVERGTISPAVSAELSALVQRRMSLLISGATGTGKTTLLNALLGCIREDERVVTIEETAELQPSCPHWVPLVTREANVEGRGAVDQSTLVRAALRLRPDRLVVGEVRGPEALAALAALATGHEGSMLTVHARSGQDALHRMVSLALGGRSGASEDALTEQVQRAFGAVVHLERDGEGRRRVAAISYLS
jgi:pilus assembly protein CpaF